MMEPSKERIELMALRLYSVIDVNEPDPHRAMAKYTLSLLLPANEALYSVCEHLSCEEHGEQDCPTFDLIRSALTALKGAGIG